VVASDLRFAVEPHEFWRVGRAVVGIVHVQGGIDGGWIELVRDGGIEPVGQDLWPTRMGIGRNVEVAGEQVASGFLDRRAEQWPEVRFRRLGLIGRHQ